MDNSNVIPHGKLDLMYNLTLDENRINDMITGYNFRNAEVRELKKVIEAGKQVIQLQHNQLFKFESDLADIKVLIKEVHRGWNDASAGEINWSDTSWKQFCEQNNFQP